MSAVPESSLEAGLAALARGDFQDAIAHLEAVCQNQLENTPVKEQAQKALIEAYKQSGETQKAIAFCQNTTPQVREWVFSNYPELVTSLVVDETGFVAFEQGVQGVGGGIFGKKDSSQKMPSQCIAPVQGEPEQEDSVLPLVASQPFVWRYAPRAKRWQPLKDVNLLPLWFLAGGSAIALFWLIRATLTFFMLLINGILVNLPYLEPYQPFYHDNTQRVLFLLLLMTIFSPWLLDILLQQFHGLQPLSLIQLSKTSPEASRVMQRYCRQHNWRLPQLRILPTSAPMALVYGNLPRTVRIVVSQGLLEQLADDEIATIYAAQLGHITHWDFVFMSLLMLVKQIIYTFYEQISLWGDRQSQPILYIAAAIASAAYGLWWLLALPGLWLSQLRIFYSDRFAVNLTGNPNGLTRALLKITIGVAKDTQQKEQTSTLYESLNMLLPTSYYQSITLGSLYPHTDFGSVLAWDCLNFYRYWLAINHTHPLLGERLQRLACLCQQLHLTPELDLPTGKTLVPTRQFLLQFAPFLAILLGLAFAGLSWLIGGISLIVWIPQLAWMFGDWLLIKAFLPIAFSIGTFIRINPLFPDITSKAVRNCPNLAQLLANRAALPINSQPLRLQGKLLGRRGIGNWLGQDLILQSNQGAIALRYQSLLGPIGYIFLRQSLNPQDLLGRHIVATGWFRRGATCWIDVDTLQTQSGKTCRSNHPLWTTISAIAIAVWGAYLLIES